MLDAGSVFMKIHFRGPDDFWWAPFLVFLLFLSLVYTICIFVSLKEATSPVMKEQNEETLAVRV